MFKDQRDPKLSRRWRLRNLEGAKRAWKEEKVSWSIWLSRHLAKGKGMQI